MYTAIIIDDDSIAITQLKRLLASYQNITIIRTFTKSNQALDYIKNTTVDIVFLDIKMPEIGGLEIASNISSNSSIIFTTSATRYALDSYNIGAVDYLLKPIIEDRLQKAITKAIDAIEINKLKKIKPIESGVQEQITVLADRKSYRLNISDIVYVESQKEYVCYFMANTKILSLGSLKDVAAILEQYSFVRIHRSHIINTQHIKHYTATSVMLSNNVELTIGRLYKNEFKKAVENIQ